MKRFLNIMLCVAMLAGCGWFKKTTKEAGTRAINCAVDTVKAKALELVPTLLTILTGGADNWKDQIGAFSKQFGVDVVACAVRSAAGALAQSISPAGEVSTPENEKAQDGLTNARTYIDEQGWSFTQ